MALLQDDGQGLDRVADALLGYQSGETGQNLLAPIGQGRRDPPEDPGVADVDVGLDLGRVGDRGDREGLRDAVGEDVVNISEEPAEAGAGERFLDILLEAGLVDCDERRDAATALDDRKTGQPDGKLPPCTTSAPRVTSSSLVIDTHV